MEMTPQTLHTPLTRLLGIRVPILLAPMGSVSGGNLVAAVSRAGGLGLVGGGYADQTWLRRELKLCSRVARFGVGFISWSLANNPKALDFALEHGPAALLFSFGDSSAYFARARDAGARIICQVQTLAQAREAAESGVDAIVAQGTEAGGHGGGRGTFALIPAVVDAVAPIPVIAAGGITDGRGLAAALMLGASGVMMGTRFMASVEALLAANAKERLLAANGDHTIRTRVFDMVNAVPWPKMFTGRALENTFTQRWHGYESELLGRLEEQRALYRVAHAQKDFDTAVVYAGEGVDGISRIEPAAAIVAHTVKQALRLLASPPDIDTT